VPSQATARVRCTFSYQGRSWVEYLRLTPTGKITRAQVESKGSILTPEVASEVARKFAASCDALDVRLKGERVARNIEVY
jgi:hypothetical protein